MTTRGARVACLRRTAHNPAVARMTTERFIRDSPGPISPRNPAVPNCRGPFMARFSSASALSSPARAASTAEASSAAVAGSGSWSTHCWARSITFIFPPELVFKTGKNRSGCRNAQTIRARLDHCDGRLGIANTARGLHPDALAHGLTHELHRVNGCSTCRVETG